MFTSLLLQLYRTHAVGSVGIKKISRLIRRTLESSKKKYSIQSTTDGNIIVTPSGSRNTHVVVSAHLDQVKTNGACGHIAISDASVITGFNSENKPTNLGADDKNGIWLALALYLQLPQDKLPTLIFFNGEESGLTGSYALSNKFYDNLQYAVVCDRKGNDEILQKGGGCLFGYETPFILLKDGWKVSHNGGISDTKNLSYHLDSVNISVGYYNQHTVSEYTVLPELHKAYELVRDALLNDSFPEFNSAKKSMWKSLKLAADGKKYVAPKYVPQVSTSYKKSAFSKFYENLWGFTEAPTHDEIICPKCGKTSLDKITEFCSNCGYDALAGASSIGDSYEF